MYGINFLDEQKGKNTKGNCDNLYKLKKVLNTKKNYLI